MYNTLETTIKQQTSIWNVRPKLFESSLNPIQPTLLLCLVFVTDRRPHLTQLSSVHRRGPCLYGCCCLYLEQFTSACHFCTFVARLPIMRQDSSLHRFLSQSLTMYSTCTVTPVIFTYLFPSRKFPLSSSSASAILQCSMQSVLSVPSECPNLLILSLYLCLCSVKTHTSVSSCSFPQYYWFKVE